MDDSALPAIGGSEIAAVVGKHPWLSIRELWQRKMGYAEPVAETQAMRMGTLLETTVARMYTAETKRRVVHPKPKVAVHPEFPWAIGHFDRVLYRRPKGLECKTTAFLSPYEWGEEGTAEIPEHYDCQVQWYLALANAIYDEPWPEWDLAVMGGLTTFRIYTIPSRPEFQAYLLTEGHEFWKRHLDPAGPRDIPAHDGSEASERVVKDEHPVSQPGEAVVAGELQEEQMLKLYHARKRLNDLEWEERLIENQLRDHMTDREQMLGRGWRITWKSQNSKPRLDWKALVADPELPPHLVDRYTGPPARPRRPFIPRWDSEWFGTSQTEEGEQDGSEKE